MVEPRELNDDCNGTPASNIGITRIATGETSLIAQQPPDAVMCNEQATIAVQKGLDPSNAFNLVKFKRRPRPAWSPDSKTLAWGEEPVPGTRAGDHIVHRLVMADIAGGPSRVVLADFPADQDIKQGQSLAWGPLGIVNIAFSTDTKLFVFDAHGSRLAQKDFGQNFNWCPTDNVTDAVWAMDTGKPIVYVTDCNFSYLLDPDLNVLSEGGTPMELYSLLAPDGLSISTGTATQNGSQLLLQGGPAAGQVVYADNGYGEAVLNTDRVAISPDGKLVAILTKDGVNVFGGDGASLHIDSPGDPDAIQWVGWGPVGFRVKH